MATTTTSELASISGAFASASNAWRAADAALPRNAGRPGSLPSTYPILVVTFAGTGSRWEISLTRTVAPLASCVIAQGGESNRTLRLTIPTVDIPIADSNPQQSNRVPYTVDPCTLSVAFYDANGQQLMGASSTVGG